MILITSFNNLGVSSNVDNEDITEGFDADLMDEALRTYEQPNHEPLSPKIAQMIRDVDIILPDFYRDEYPQEKSVFFILSTELAKIYDRDDAELQKNPKYGSLFFESGFKTFFKSKLTAIFRAVGKTTEARASAAQLDKQYNDEMRKLVKVFRLKEKKLEDKKKKEKEEEEKKKKERDQLAQDQVQSVLPSTSSNVKKTKKNLKVALPSSQSSAKCSTQKNLNESTSAKSAKNAPIQSLSATHIDASAQLTPPNSQPIDRFKIKTSKIPQRHSTLKSSTQRNPDEIDANIQSISPSSDHDKSRIPTLRPSVSFENCGIALQPNRIQRQAKLKVNAYYASVKKEPKIKLPKVPDVTTSTKEAKVMKTVNNLSRTQSENVISMPSNVKIQKSNKKIT